MNDQTRPLVLHFDDQAAAARRFATALARPCLPIATRRFPDGESLVRLPVPLPPRVLLFCTLGSPDTRLVELMLAARTARELGVAHLTLVAPYLCYMRQDAAFQPGEAVSQRIVGGFLAGLFDAVVTVDPHLHRIDRLEQAVPVAQPIVLGAAPLLAGLLASLAPDAVVVGPDEESMRWVAPIAERAGRPHTTFVKTRHGDRDVEVVAESGPPITGRHVVLIDDIASSGRTLAQAARLCLAQGARAVDALVTHALCADEDLRVLHEAGVTRLWSTDSLAHSSNRVELAPLLAQGCREHGLA